MKKLTSLDKYVIVPNVNFYGGFVFDGEDIELCDDHDVDEGYDFKVKQRIEAGILITDIERTCIRVNGQTVKENSHQEVGLEKGDLLVYVEGLGFTIPESKLCKIDEAVEQYELLKG